MAVILILILNFGISCINAYSVGLAWFDSKAQGWFARFVNACAMIMSICGFTYVYAVIFAFIAKTFHWLPDEYVAAIIQVCYLVIIIPVVGSGIGITLHSLLQAWRSRSFLDVGAATYNTFAQAYNTYNAFNEFGGVFSSVVDLFSSNRSSSSSRSSSSDDDDNGGAFVLIALALVGLALFSGVITTAVIASKAAEQQAIAVRRELRDLRQG